MSDASHDDGLDVDGGFDDSQVLTPEQLAELLAGMPDLPDPELPTIIEESEARPMIGFVDGPSVPVMPPAPRRDYERVRSRPMVRPDRDLPPGRVPVVMDAEAAASLAWLFR